MVHHMTRALAIGAGTMLGAQSALAETPVLNVLTYDSFVAEWGPGPAIETAFEAVCGCDLQFQAAGDGAALLARLQLEGANSEADVILGLDTNLTAAAADTGLFAPHGVSAEVDVPNPASDSGQWDDPLFLPYDWGYFAFVHDADMENVPADLKALAASDHSIVIQDPRSSTPGLGLVLWVKALYGDEAPEVWAALADNIVTVTPSWSEAYGLFLEGEADMVLSYTTSPAYHRIAEEDESKVAAIFPQHYMQIEVAGVLEGSDQPELARQFLTFLLGEAAQGVLPTTNWMYPAIMPEGGLPEGMDAPLPAESAVILAPDEVQSVRQEAIEEWRAALAR